MHCGNNKKMKRENSLKSLTRANSIHDDSFIIKKQLEDGRLEEKQ